MKPYRILIAWNGEKFQGASMQEKEGEEFRFIPETVWPDLCETINADALATVDAQAAQLTTLRSELAAYKARGLQAAKAVNAILDNPGLTPKQKTVAINAVTTDIQANERVRQKAKAMARLAEAQAEAAKFNG